MFKLLLFLLISGKYSPHSHFHLNILHSFAFLSFSFPPIKTPDISLLLTHFKIFISSLLLLTQLARQHL